MRTQRGFTFIELLLYISIVTVMLTAIIPFAWNVIEGGSKSSAEQEVFSQARYVSERIKYEIRNATGIDAVNSNFDNLATGSTKKLRLTELSPVNTYDINVTTAGIVQGKPGNGSASDLNSQDTKVTNLTFTNYSSTSDTKTKHVGFTLTVIVAGSSQRQEFKETITLRSSAEVRSN